MTDHDFNFEPQPGLPAPLPRGENILWQGKPETAQLARDAFNIRWITGYLVVLALGQAAFAFVEGGAVYALARGLPYLALAILAFAVIYGLAWMQARAAIYTITSSRVILRIGAALPITYTIPYSCVSSAALATEGVSGSGSLAMKTNGNMRLSYAVLWPHARPWHIATPEPTFRSIANAAQVARILSDAAEAKINEPQVESVQRPHHQLAAAE